MALRSFFGDRRYWALLKPLAVVAATKRSGLTPRGARLAALAVTSTLLLHLLMASVLARTPFASTLKFLLCTTTISGRIAIPTAGHAIPINTGQHCQSVNLCKATPGRPISP